MGIDQSANAVGNLRRPAGLERLRAIHFWSTPNGRAAQGQTNEWRNLADEKAE
jgi:hypothetical protein